MVLFEASEGVDEGPIYSRRVLRLDGTELLGELRRKQWAVMEEMIEEFLLQPDRAGVPQEGEPSTYRRRTREDDELPLDQTLEELFPRLRIADNENWPVYFRRAGRTYVLKIYPGDS
jgi:methionyl-tRNA formyltransferase